MRIVEDRKPTASRLGSYEVLHRFAAGGMAELFLARSVGPEGFEKLVVLKKILPRLATNERFVRLFLDEARLAASLDHPNIAHVYDLGRVDGNYFFAMEYVHGRDLRSALHRSVNRATPLPIEHAVHISRDVAAALDYAHERCGGDGNTLGIVHRDVSPSNVFIAYDGTVKLLDFGVAKAATSSVKTRTGSLKGKVSYMSPEQAKGATVDRRSDIFSLGIVMWEMVTSRRLFKGPNDLATIQLIINHPPPAPSSLRPGCPPELDRIIARALAQDPAARYQTANELQSDLEELARENKLNLSSIALGRHLNVLFAAELEAWRKARAAGVSLADHLLATTATEPVEITPSSEFSEEVDRGVEQDGEVTERTPPPVTPRRRDESADRSSVRLSSGRTPPPQLDHPVTKEPSIVIEPALIDETEAELLARTTPVPAASLTFAAPVDTPLSDAGWRTPPTIASRPAIRAPGRGKWIALAVGTVAIAAGLVIVKTAGDSPSKAAELAPPPVESESRTISLDPTPAAEPKPTSRTIVLEPAPAVAEPAKPAPAPPPPIAETKPAPAAAVEPAQPAPPPVAVEPKPMPPPVAVEPAKPAPAIAKPAPAPAPAIAAKPAAAPPPAHPPTPVHTVPVAVSTARKPSPPPAPPPAKHPAAKPPADRAKPATKFDPDAALPPM